MASSMPAGASDRALDRRQLLKAGAWSAPALALAVAVPAAAASDTPQDAPVQNAVPTVTSGSGSEKKNVAVSVTGTANAIVTATLTVTSPIKKPGTWSDGKSGDVPQVQTATNTGTVTFTFPTFIKQNASNGYTYTITFSVDGQIVDSATISGSF